MRTQLISIPTETTPLDGALHLPDTRQIGAVLLFHGNTMNFYVGAPRFLPPALTAMGYACLAFNRRGHDILSIRDSRAAEGAAFQLTHEGIEDNATAARWMQDQGFPPPVIIGHSNGGMLAVPHVVAHPKTPALILLSAHGGGRDGLRRTSRSGLMAADRLEELTATAHTMVAAGRGRDLMLMPGWWYVITAESFLDRASQMPDTLELAPKITCPVLYAATKRTRRTIPPRRSATAPAARARSISSPTAIISIAAVKPP
jgi:pimeloyl-ACP methyl ester carboxylesterase